MRRANFALLAAALSAAACDQVTTTTGPEAARRYASVPPVIVEGNPTCTALGYDFGFKIDSRADFNGTYTVQSGSVVIGTVTVSTPDQTTFNWSSTFGVDAVIGKGGNIGANVFHYSPESMGDTGLTQPNNPSGAPAEISHIDFCFDFELTVSKTAATKYTRTFNWSIDKTGSVSTLLLNKDQAYTIDYTVKVTPTAVDSDWGVTGTITIRNPAPFPATVTSVTDVISVGIIAGVTCPATPFAVPAGGSVTCTYGSALPDASARLNTATVTTDASAKVTLSSEGEALKLYGTGGVSGGSGQAAVTFGAPTNEIDETAQVTDSYAGALGSATRAPGSFSYSRSVSFSTCGEHGIPNTASVAGTDSGAGASDAWNVTATVTGCDGGPSACTLTQGYWKTHSIYGAAKYDATWAGREDTPFYLSGSSWLGVLRTAPRGDAYYILAHQFIAATLNKDAGANTSAVSAELAQAQTLLAAAQPGSVRGALRETFLALAAKLDAYNNGLIGPGHCSENAGP